PAVRERYYGCGMVYPQALTGARVLDLGCGSGRDCYVLAQLVGPGGRVVGVDMTPPQLELARDYRDWHMDAFGFDEPKVEFHHGYIEQLGQLDLEPASFDVIVSNCVINLATDKPAVLRGAHALLKPGGELYFADVYADRRVPAAAAADPVLYGECLGGALYWSDFETLARAAGFADPRLVEDNPIEVSDPALAAAIGDTRFYSATYRLFRLDELEPQREDYGQRVTYLGPEPAFRFDKTTRFLRHEPTAVCGNTWRMLHDSRLARLFRFDGDFSRHRGCFTGERSLPFSSDLPPRPAGACC
ncbi:MAG: methyltransferase domain-containing protein, partial [Gammaproteobacteria bacterium]